MTERTDINFDCPECGQNIDAPADMAGYEVECPSCSAVILIPEQKTSESGEKEKVPASEPASDQKFKTAGQVASNAEKSTTTRIELPPDFEIQKPHRKIVIRRRQQ